MKKAEKNLLIYCVLGVLGLALIVISVIMDLDEIYTGFGGGIVGVCVMRIVLYVLYKKVPSYAKRTEIENKDERNLYLANKARSIAFTMGTCVCAVASVAAFLFNMRETGILLGYIVCLFLLLFWVADWFLKRNS